MSLLSRILEKLNPVQHIISSEDGDNISSTSKPVTYDRAYKEIDVVRRGVDMIVNGVASFDYMIAEQIQGITPVAKGVRKARVISLLNFQPNLFQSINVFRRLLAIDLILDGNCFMYFDGIHLFHLPASNVTILTDPKTLVKGYKYSASTETFAPNEIIHIQDNSSSSIYRGEPRLKAAEMSIRIISAMLDFQHNFFENGAVPGLILQSPNVLGDKIKERMIQTWMVKYNPRKGGKKPMILDGGLTVKNLTDTNFTELDFADSVKEKESAILKALGVPPILLDGGNNANIAPNLKLFYLETVLPIAQNISSGFERFFGYDLEPETGKISALQPQMSEAGSFYGGLVNGGILSPNEAREELRWDPYPDPEMDKIRVPQNIAGSAVNPTQGGKPPAAPKG